MPYTLPRCTCACATPESPRLCHSYTGISSRIVSPLYTGVQSLYTSVSRGAKGPSIPHRLVVPSTCKSISLSFPSESHRRANFAPYSQCGLPASSMAYRTTRFFQTHASTQLASSVCRLAPGCAKRLTSSTCTSVIIKQQHSPSLPLSPQNLSLSPRVIYLGYVDRSVPGQA